MECPLCNFALGEYALYCNRCGKKLPDIIKEEAKEEIRQTLKSTIRLDKSDGALTPGESANSSNTDEKNDVEYIQETDDPRKFEYKQLMSEIIADGRVTANEVVMLARCARSLGLDKHEALNLQRDVAREHGFAIEEEGDITSCGAVLEINTNKAYLVDKMDNLEFRVTNTTGDYLENITTSCAFVHLNEDRKKTLLRLRPSPPEIIRIPFMHKYSGNELVTICLQYSDTKGNPSIYRSEIEMNIFKDDTVTESSKSISLSFKADKIMGNDFSDMVSMLEGENKPRPKRGSFLSPENKQWQRICTFLDEEETRRRRNEILISRKMDEGESQLSRGRRLEREDHALFHEDREAADRILTEAFDCFKKAEECFKKVRELDPEHVLSLKRIKEIRGVISSLEEKIMIMKKGRVPEAVKVASAHITLHDMEREIFLYSKERITMGRSKGNDIVLRLAPYRPKEIYQENWEKSQRISGTHATIANRGNSFYIRDGTGGNEGSTNGTFVDGKRAQPGEDYLLGDGTRINIARVLDLECIVLCSVKKERQMTDTLGSCLTVLGDVSESCFGIDKIGAPDAIKIKRRNNYTEGEEYIILIREVTIGKSGGNGIIIGGKKTSDIHAKLFCRDDSYWLEDRNSIHGTWVNGQRAEPGVEVPLGMQAEIVLGDVVMTFSGNQ